MSAFFTLAVLAGIVAGTVLPVAGQSARLEALVGWALMVLLATIGFELGADRAALRRALARGHRLLALPLVVAVASLLGAAAGGAATGFPWRPALAAGAGFGWYSMSGVLVGHYFGAQAGAVAFVANLLRELAVLAAAPALVRRVGEGGLVGAAGATAMDSTLPAIARTAGSQAAVTALVSGAILTLLAPVLIGLLAAVGSGGM